MLNFWWLLILIYLIREISFFSVKNVFIFCCSLFVWVVKYGVYFYYRFLFILFFFCSMLSNFCLGIGVVGMFYLFRLVYFYIFCIKKVDVFKVILIFCKV